MAREALGDKTFDEFYVPRAYYLVITFRFQADQTSHTYGSGISHALDYFWVKVTDRPA